MDPQQAQAAHIMAAMLPVIVLIWVVVLAFIVFCFWRIFTKAGMAGPLALLLIIPAIGPLVVICLLAFGTWSVVPATPYAAIPPAYPPTYPPPPAS